MVTGGDIMADGTIRHRRLSSLPAGSQGGA